MLLFLQDVLLSFLPQIGQKHSSQKYKQQIAKTYAGQRWVQNEREHSFHLMSPTTSELWDLG